MQDGNEKDKVLILGCSFTQGSYAPDPTDTKREIIESSFGWYDKLSYFEDRQIDVYGCGGCGLTTYASILNQLDKNRTLKEYSSVIIQETSEPRLSLFQKNHTWNINIPDNPCAQRTLNITHYSTFANHPHAVFCAHPFAIDWIFAHYDLNETSDKYKLDLLLSPTLMDLVDQSKSHIKLLLEKNDISCFVFSLFGAHLSDPFFQRLPLSPNLYAMVKSIDTDCLSGPDLGIKHLSKHFSIRGNEVLGELVNNAFKELNYV